MQTAKKILIVEDEPAIMEALSSRLREEGFTVAPAKNGQEGLQTALAQHPDLILLDIVMPVMDGTEMLEKLRLDDWGKTAPVMFLTNSNDLEKITKAIENNVTDYLLKADWKLDEVVKRIKEKLGLSS